VWREIEKKEKKRTDLPTKFAKIVGLTDDPRPALCHPPNLPSQLTMFCAYGGYGLADFGPRSRAAAGEKLCQPHRGLPAKPALALRRNNIRDYGSRLLHLGARPRTEFPSGTRRTAKGRLVEHVTLKEPGPEFVGVGCQTRSQWSRGAHAGASENSSATSFKRYGPMHGTAGTIQSGGARAQMGARLILEASSPARALTIVSANNGDEPGLPRVTSLCNAGPGREAESAGGNVVINRGMGIGAHHGAYLI